MKMETEVKWRKFSELTGMYLFVLGVIYGINKVFGTPATILMLLGVLLFSQRMTPAVKASIIKRKIDEVFNEKESTPKRDD